MAVKRVTLAALDVTAVNVAALVVNVEYVQRGEKVMCRATLAGVGVDDFALATATGGIKYWTSVQSVLDELANALNPPAVASFTVIATGAALLVSETAQTVQQQRAALSALIVKNQVNTTALKNQVALIADAPAALVALQDEKTALESRLAGLPPA